MSESIVKKSGIQEPPEPMRMPILVLRGLVLFPQMVLHFDVGREKSLLALNKVMSGDRRIFLVAQKDIRDDEPKAQNLYKIGVVAQVKQIIKSQGGTWRVLVEGLYRAKLLEVLGEEPYFEGQVVEFPLRITRSVKSAMCNALMRTVKELFEEYCYLTPRMPKELVVNALISEDPVHLAEYIAGNMQMEVADKQAILSQSEPLKRLEILAHLLEEENDILSLEADIQEKVKGQVDKNQREYYLREQLKVISNELGEDDEQDEAADYYERIEKLNLDGQTAEKLRKEVDRLTKLPGNSNEAGVIRGYLDTVLELPWDKCTQDKIDIKKAGALLNREHYGLQKVKERILELLAVRKLAPDIKGQIICLVGPPGVGKTSIARSIAKSMGRKYTRISLGGVRDESDIRGHRKTYIGAMPGRIMNAMKLAGSRNPLMLLDEVDKLGNDYRGDPSAALLEVLDSEQNHAFRDHFIEVPFDLSDVLFIATANTLDTIPRPLLDRMEVIELTSYTREEKFQIAKKHLYPKQLKRHGLTAAKAKLADDALYALIDNYTREAGVRRLEREIASLLRKAAKRIVSGEEKKVVVDNDNIVSLLGPRKFRPELISPHDEIGLVNGLAWTSVGGELLQVEIAVMDGTGKLELTGSLGDVMKESARAAVSFIRTRWEEYGVDHDFYKTKDLHIHVPEGAVPKDGPSAGVTICTALVSALSGTPVCRDVAMTGEITLRGRVLPIGGLREKAMAAYRAGVRTVVIPAENEPDLADIDPVVRGAVRFVTAERIDTVLDAALVDRPQKQAPQPLSALPAAAPEQPLGKANSPIPQ
ncbi:endopeptidase La [Anaerotruncus sp.]|jgi:ATP-dependent Lon protease|uniref:endopeptidase La n=1 Tax=Anaerotruncus TaxID=244127 RepID=UPI0025C22D7B|nr:MULTISPECIES: endopeptidase La [Anaerotruncus]